MADINLVARPDRILGHGDSQRRQKIGRLIEGRNLVGFARAFGVFENKNAVAFGPVGRPVVQLVPVVDGFAHPHSALVVDVDARRIGKERFGRPERQFQLGIVNRERGQRFFRRHLGFSLMRHAQEQPKNKATPFHKEELLARRSHETGMRTIYREETGFSRVRPSRKSGCDQRS